jgi:hypothetical protein
MRIIRPLNARKRKNCPNNEDRRRKVFAVGRGERDKSAMGVGVEELSVI